MKRLIVFDMDGVIFESSNFWMELHKVYGTLEEGKELTKKYLKTNYAKLVEEVVGRLWKGKPEMPFIELVNSAKYTSGAEKLFSFLKTKGVKTALISSGPRQLAERAKKKLNIDHIFTNSLIFRDGRATGEFEWPIASDRKAVILRELCVEYNIDFGDCIAVVHDDNDIKMAKVAGFTIGFCPDSQEIQKYCNKIITKKDLSEIIPLIEQL